MQKCLQYCHRVVIVTTWMHHYLIASFAQIKWNVTNFVLTEWQRCLIKNSKQDLIVLIRFKFLVFVSKSKQFWDITPAKIVNRNRFVDRCTYSFFGELKIMMSNYAINIKVIETIKKSLKVLSSFHKRWAIWLIYATEWQSVIFPKRSYDSGIESLTAPNPLEIVLRE